MQTSVKCLKLMVTEVVPQNTLLLGSWWIGLKKSLVRFASRIQHMPRLKSFSLVSNVFYRPSQFQEDVLFTSMSTLLCSLPATVTSLTIDSSGAPPNPTPGPREKRRNHFCSLLLNKSLMPHLRHLCIRSRTICPEILEAISSDKFDRLESLIINLSLGRQDIPLSSKVFYAHLCPGFQSNGKDLYSSLIDAAKAIIPRLPCLKTLRIVRQNFPAEDLFSFDVIQDRRAKLPLRADWKAIDHVNGDDSEYSSDSSELSQDSTSSTESDDETS